MTNDAILAADATVVFTDPTAKRKRTKRATIEDFAVTEFEPWTEPDGIDKSCVRQDLTIVGMLIPYCYDLMFKTKDELKAEIATWPDDKGELISRAFIDATAFIKAASTLINAAECRILVAGAALEVEGA